MRSFVLAVVFAALAFPAHAQKQPFTIEALYKIKNVSDPQFSPDGDRVAFSVTSFNLEKGSSNSDIYIMDADGGNVRKMTSSDDADFHPRWSPDGKWLLFVSTREDGAQVWRMPMGGGEATQLTNFALGVSDPVWSPDGRRVYFFSEVFPECGADSECNDKIQKDMDGGPVHAHLADDLLYRHWTFWKDGKRFHVIAYDIDTDSYTDLTPGAIDFPAFVTGGNAGYDVAPDGTELCVSGNPDPNEWETTNKDLFVLATGGGELMNITDENEAYDANPQYSPDGRYIGYITQVVPRYESDKFRLAVYDRRTKQKRVLTEDFDNWVSSFLWAPDSKSIYFLVHEEGSHPLYQVELKSGKIRPVMDLRTIDSFDISPDGKNIVASRRSVGEPREIWGASNKGKNIERLTTFNKEVEDEVDIRPVEEMWIDSPTGRKIHTFIVKPHNFDPNRSYPLILNVHGGPQGQWFDSFRGDWQVYPGAGYIVAFPNPHGSSGFGQEFTREISRDWAGNVYDDVMAVADHLAAQPWVDEKRMGAMGWSYGGYMMMWMAGHTDRFKCIASMMGVYDLPAMWGATEELWFPQFDLGGTPWESDDYQKFSPHKFAANFKMPTLVITGEKDFRVPYTQSLEFFTALRKNGVESRLIVFENDGHWPSWVKSMPLYYAAHLDWFHRYLGGGPSPYDIEEMVRNRAFKSDD